MKFSRPIVLLALAIILSGGIFLRVWPSTGFRHVGYDEGVYRAYVSSAVKIGIWNYPALVDVYVKSQRERAEAMVPPTRIGFLLPASALAATFHLDPLLALRGVSATAAILLLLVTPLIAYRLGDAERMLLLSLLVAVAPLQIHLAQRALIDGYFAFWAVLCAWFLWENLRTPNHAGWLCAFGFSLFVLILTKENAAFVLAALAVTYLVFQTAGLSRGGSVTVLFVSLGVVLLALFILASMVGGLGEWISFYQMFVRKSAALPYARIHQDGPWFRYLIDFILLSPLVVVFALARLFRIDKQSPADLFWALFLGASYVVMSVIPYGQSLRFAAYWDLPLRWLALSQLLACAPRFRRFNPMFAVGLAMLVFVSVDLFQYWRYFVWGAIYDPVSFQLFRVSGFVK